MFQTVLYKIKYNYSKSSSHGELQPQREGGIVIMELKTEFYSKTTSRKIMNRVRMAFGLVHLSDMTMSNGKYLE